MQDAWSQTYKCHHVTGSDDINILTAIHTKGGPATLVAELEINVRGDNGICHASVRHTLTSDQMRNLAGLLIDAAERIDTVLNPLLARLLAAAPAEVAPPAALYAEPEAA